MQDFLELPVNYVSLLVYEIVTNTLDKVTVKVACYHFAIHVKSFSPKHLEKEKTQQ